MSENNLNPSVEKNLDINQIQTDDANVQNQPMAGIPQTESIADKILRQVAEKRKENEALKSKVETPEENNSIDVLTEEKEEPIENTLQAEAAAIEEPIVAEQPIEEKEILVAEQIIATDNVSSIIRTDVEIPMEFGEKGIAPENEEDEEIEEDGEEEETEEEIDYTVLTPQEIVSKFAALLEEKPVQRLKPHIDSLRSVFYRMHNAEVAKQKKEFIEKGGVEFEFQPEPNPLELQIKELYKTYRDKRQAHSEKLEAEKVNNAKKKYEIIEKINNLINSKESINKTFNDFRDLQNEWRDIGAVQQSEVKGLWESYHHTIEKFYDFIKINKELRDLDLKKNLDIKIELCEKAEELLLEESIVKAFRVLQSYHNQWRETGPIPVEKKDELWERFKETTTKINKLYQDHFESLKNERENNLNAKILLCEKAEEIATSDLSKPKDWEDKSKELVELQKIWKLIGFAPKKDNQKVYTRFRTACDDFFSKKREYYAETRSEQNNNLQAKTELCLQAESLRDSTDWKLASETFISLQKQWKTIGPIPRKHSDILWKRFRSACNAFFDKKTKHFSGVDAEQDGNLQKKLSLIQEVKAYEFADSQEENLNHLKDFQKRWTEIGHVPFKKKDEVQKEFRALINERFDQLRSDESRRNEIRFKSKIENLQQGQKSQQKIKLEKDKIRQKLERVESDIVLWENNIGFFAKSKNSESLINDFNKKIVSAKELAKSLKEKLDMMSKIDE